MPIIKSAKKRVKTTKKATSKNLRAKRSLRAAVKELRVASGKDSKKAVSDAKRKAQSALDKAAKKGIMHKHKVARKQRQLSAQVKALAPAKTKTTVKKPAAKKTATKK